MARGFLWNSGDFVILVRVCLDDRERIFPDVVAAIGAGTDAAFRRLWLYLNPDEPLRDKLGRSWRSGT